MYHIGDNPAYVLGLIIGLGLLYFSPSIIGAVRRVERLGVVILLNFIAPLWPAALLGAFMLPRRRLRQFLPAASATSLPKRW